MAIVPGVAATCHRGEEVSDGTVVWVGDARAPKKGHGRHFARAQRTFSLVARTTPVAPDRAVTDEFRGTRHGWTKPPSVKARERSRDGAESMPSAGDRKALLALIQQAADAAMTAELRASSAENRMAVLPEDLIAGVFLAKCLAACDHESLHRSWFRSFFVCTRNTGGRGRRPLGRVARKFSCQKV